MANHNVIRVIADDDIIYAAGDGIDRMIFLQFIPAERFGRRNGIKFFVRRIPEESVQNK